MSPDNHHSSTSGTPVAPAPSHTGPALAAHADDHHSHVPIKYSKGTNGLVAVFALLVLGGLAAAFLIGTHARNKAAADLKAAAEHDADQPPPVNVMRVRRAAVDSVITLPGEARAFYETTLFARTNGYVNKWLVDIGDRVEQGQPLATIDTPELDDQVAAAKSKVEGLKAAAELKEAADRAADQPPPVNVMHVRRAGVDSVITLPGEARAFYETTLFARTNGYVNKWLVDIGDSVEQGQPLATIDTPELDDQIAAAKSKVEGLKADVKVAQSNADFAKVSYERWAAAAPDGVVSAQERDQKKAELDASLAKLEAAKAQVTIAQGDVQRLTTMAKFKTVTAPFKGTITQRHVDVGALVTAGSTSNTSSLFTISQSDQLRVFVQVPQAAVADVKVGMPVTAQVREYPGRTFTGKVGRTAESIDPAARTLKVEVLIPNQDHVLLPGMFTWVTFTGSRSNPPVEIPAAAICMRSDGPKVAVVGKDDQVTFKPVTIGRDLGEYIEVASGLTGDETVALNIGNDVTDGTRIETRLVEDTKPGPAPKPANATAAVVTKTVLH